MKIVKLSEAFYMKYKNCAEIMQKPTRPYYCVSVVVDGRTFAIPFRHHIRHKYCFHTIGEAGIDYSKAVIIKNQNDISDEAVNINTAEYRTLKGREAVITNGMRKFLALYKKASRHQDNPNYKRIVECSSLQYFL